jgi:hypothetical protein
MVLNSGGKALTALGGTSEISMPLRCISARHEYLG